VGERRDDDHGFGGSGAGGLSCEVSLCFDSAKCVQRAPGQRQQPDAPLVSSFSGDHRVKGETGHLHTAADPDIFGVDGAVMVRDEKAATGSQSFSRVGWQP
jgi:hypothetical protein